MSSYHELLTFDGHSDILLLTHFMGSYTTKIFNSLVPRGIYNEWLTRSTRSLSFNIYVVRYDKWPENVVAKGYQKHKQYFGNIYIVQHLGKSTEWMKRVVLSRVSYWDGRDLDKHGSWEHLPYLSDEVKLLFECHHYQCPLLVSILRFLLLLNHLLMVDQHLHVHINPVRYVTYTYSLDRETQNSWPKLI